MGAPRISIVVPAHDEANVIGATLMALRSEAPRDLEVIVVANACRDDTADVARRSGATVLETEVAGKAHALNLGDAACGAFPRVYLDADVLLTGRDLTVLVDHMASSGALAAAPAFTYDPAPLTWIVRAYYRVWTALPYIQRSLVGSGVYALSREGRSRFDTFPEAIGDDTFVHGLFSPDERVSVPGAVFVARPPRTLRALLTVKTRVWVGNEQHAATTAGSRAPAGGTSRRRTGLRRAFASRAGALARHPRLWPDLLVYAGVYLVVRLRARSRLRRGDTTWSRDETSRVRTVEGVGRRDRGEG